MPKLTELVEQRTSGKKHDDECPRCQHRKGAVYVQARALRRISQDPSTNRSHSPATKTNKTVLSTGGVHLCRVCAREVLGIFARLLETEVRDGEAD